MNEYKSIFAEYIQGVLDARSYMGYAKDTHAAVLKSFDRYCLECHPDCSELTKELIMPWLLKESNDKTGVQNRAAAIRILAQYIQLSGQDAYLLPERYFGKKPSGRKYIFSDTEIHNLFTAIDALPNNKKVPYSNLILPVLFRLIYTCGLRPREGRELKRKNINLNTGEILLTNTKKKKERLVVMSDDMLSLCRKYDKMRQFFYQDNVYFFPGSENGCIDEEWLNRQFNKAWRNANPEMPKDALPRVRIYDLRHRFASANLDRWLDEGKDLTAMLPRLRAYMGHHTMSETAHYIHLLPENLVKNRGIAWDSFPDIIPEVDIWQE